MPTITRTDIPSVANMAEIEREALAMWLAQALTAAGVTNRSQRLAMQGHLASLIER
jgi:hypothetical protein